MKAFEEFFKLVQSQDGPNGDVCDFEVDKKIKPFDMARVSHAPPCGSC